MAEGGGRQCLDGALLGGRQRRREGDGALLEHSQRKGDQRRIRLEAAPVGAANLRGVRVLRSR